MAKREKKVVTTGVTRNEMETSLAEYAQADARLQQIAANMDAQITKIREKHASEITNLTATKEKAFDVVQAFAVENKEDLFKKKRSLESSHGVFGFRTGTPKLKTLKGFTWPKVVLKLKELLPDYVRTIEEAAKDKLLADRESKKVKPLLEKVGICVTQDETFFIELKKENEQQA